MFNRKIKREIGKLGELLLEEKVEHGHTRNELEVYKSRAEYAENAVHRLTEELDNIQKSIDNYNDKATAFNAKFRVRSRNYREIVYQAVWYDWSNLKYNRQLKENK